MKRNNKENKNEKTKNKKKQLTKRQRVLRKTLKIFLIILSAVLLTIIVYLAYVFMNYSRIDDNQKLKAEGKSAAAEVEIGKTYTALTYNIGFGAHTPDFTAFMDGGSQAWASSEKTVLSCVNGVAAAGKTHHADFVFYQEVDTDSNRSYRVNEAKQITDKYTGYSSVYAENFHSPFLMYPIHQPLGISNSGLLTLSNVKINSAVRRSLPVAGGISKYFDIDRCYSVARIAVNNGKELVAYNIHTSAYTDDSKVQEEQLKMLLNDMENEYKKGNYVICGGDFNHDFTGDSVKKLNPDNAEEHSWTRPFPDKILPKGINKNTGYSDNKTTPTARNCDKPYDKNSFTVITDGFLTSDNIDVILTQNINTHFNYSDHNPVVIKFELK